MQFVKLLHACMKINKYHVVVVHLTCMGTSRILGVNAPHEKNSLFRKGARQTYRSLSKNEYRRVVHIIIEVCPNEKISEGGPKFYRSLSN